MMSERMGQGVCVLLACAAHTERMCATDLASGVYHWGVDNYGDGDTPVFGSQIAGFQVSITSPMPFGLRL